MSQKLDFKLPINPRYNTRSISWSDLLMIEQDAEAWLKGKRLKTNRYMEYGTSIHAEIKHRKHDVPTGTAPEQIYTVKISDGKIKFHIVGKPDDTDDDTIYEYKTGTTLWGKKQAETHGQLFTYALLKWKHSGKIPKRALLISLKTAVDEDVGVYLTGDRVIHEIPITLKDVLLIQARFINAYKKVSTLGVSL